MAKNHFNSVVVRNKQTGNLETICLDTGEVLNANINQADMSRFRFDFNMAILVCQKVREGMTLKEIAHHPDFPDINVLHYWRRTNASFEEELRLARKERAEHYHDSVMELADKIVDKDELAVAKFKADQYKWAAEKGDPASYGNKIEHTGSNVAPSIVVMTGINRKPDVEVEYEEIPHTGREGSSDSYIGGGVSGSLEGGAGEEEAQAQESGDDEKDDEESTRH